MKPMHDPFNPKGKLIYVGVLDEAYIDFAIEYTDVPYGKQLSQIQTRIDSADILVGANFKFDLHWLRRYGCHFPDKLVWDVLLVQFILNHQLTPFNSLEEVYAQWGIVGKSNTIKTEYWDRGIDTDKVPENVLQERLRGDILPMAEIYQKQMAEVLKRGILPLIRIHNQDLLVLAEMEWNGNLYDVKGSRLEAAKELLEIRKIKKGLNILAGFRPKCWSPDFISLLLYGGLYKYQVEEAFIFTYKNGSTKEKVHNVEKQIELPRLVPPPKQARAKEGFWPTDEATLQKLKAVGAAKKIIFCLLQLRGKEKFVGTYLKGFPAKIAAAQWEGNKVHTNYNQVRTVTGRLSSDKPNCQNVPIEQKGYFVSRFS